LAVLCCALPTMAAAQGITVEGIVEAAVETQHDLVFQVMNSNNTLLKQAGLTVVLSIASEDPIPPVGSQVCVAPESTEDSRCLTSATTNANGQVRALLRVGHTAGDLKIQAQAPGGKTGSHAVKVLVADLAVTSGNTQRAPEGSALPNPLEAQLTDGERAGIAGQCVTAEVTQGDGTLESDAACPMASPGSVQQVGNQAETGKKVTTLTDANGKVKFTLRAGSSDEDIVVKVSALGLAVQFLAIVGSLDTPDIPQDIDVVGDVVYIADRFAGLWVIDVREPTNPQFLEAMKFAGTVSRLALDLDANRLYVPTAFPPQLNVLDITQPAGPQSRGVVDLVGEVQDHVISGIVANNGHAFIVTDDRIDNSGTLQVVDVRDVNNPWVVGTAPLEPRPNGIAVLGNRAYVPGGYVPGGGLLIFNITDPSQPSAESKLEGDFRSDITLNGNVAYVVEFRDGQNHFTVLDLSDPSVPQRRGTLLVQNVRSINTAFPIAVSGRFTYLVEFASGLAVIDVSNPDMPRLVDRIDTPSEALNIATTGGFSYVTDFVFGLQVIRGPLFDLDTNRDNIADAFRDTDSDGIIDFFDVFPANAAEQQDTDRDGIGDNADLDDDGDGFSDAAEQSANPSSDPKDPFIFPLTLPPSGTTILVVDDSTATAPAVRNGTPATPYRSITEGLRAIKALRQGVVSADEMLTLEVRAGTYSPTTTQEIFPLAFAGIEPLTLRGEGQEATMIDAAFTSNVLDIIDATGVVIEDVTCLHGANGIFVNFSESITLRRNRITENALNGIELGINTLNGILIAGNLIEGNVKDGIVLFEKTMATILANTIRANESRGVVVQDQSTAEISLNTIEANTLDGVQVFNKSMAAILANTIRANERFGILVEGDKSTAEISLNTIEANMLDGVQVSNKSTATILANTIRANERLGILVTGESTAEISLNTIEANTDDGVQVFNKSTSIFTGNEIRSNGGLGIFVVTNACAVINGGTIADSGGSGVPPEGSGVLLKDASSAAIGFGSEAAGDLTLSQNVGDGITIFDDSSFALINRARVIFDANGGGEIVGPFTENPA
ncbi:MAG: right-handed parallel beta-helix repeat-containing protein, partial [Candidatus Tectomicrobia bacterium]|nr:right-handed parallel beta-helix repeat-containing protein [Candidatus Tectomicrobia bacterium]